MYLAIWLLEAVMITWIVDISKYGRENWEKDARNFYFFFWVLVKCTLLRQTFEDAAGLDYMTFKGPIQPIQLFYDYMILWSHHLTCIFLKDKFCYSGLAIVRWLNHYLDDQI